MRNARMSRFPQPPPGDLRALTQMLLDPHNHVMTITDDSEDNIYAGSVDDVNGDHHVVFASERQIQLMRTFRVLHSDGTFKSVPTSRMFAAQVSSREKGKFHLLTSMRKRNKNTCTF